MLATPMFGFCSGLKGRFWRKANRTAWQPLAIVFDHRDHTREAILG